MDKEIVHAVLDKMGDMLNIKVIAGAVLGLVTHKYSILMLGFGVLLYLDILTKWIAISYAYLLEQGNEAPAFFDAVKGINSARKARKINSTEMRTRGVSKLFVYCICFLMAAIFDLMSMAAGGSSQIIQIVCGYQVIWNTIRKRMNTPVPKGGSWCLKRSGGRNTTVDM